MPTRTFPVASDGADDTTQWRTTIPGFFAARPASDSPPGAPVRVIRFHGTVRKVDTMARMGSRNASHRVRSR